ncbi:MAG: hypothetical protein J6K42_02835 [Clostridia bacterium]|nr:hypothetical protein [Clostridia bacterium]
MIEFFIMKNYKSKMFKLLIVFILIIIILVFGVKYFKKVMYDKENYDIKTNMLVIQGKIKLLKGEAEVSKNEDVYIGTKISNLDNREIREFMQNLGVEESKFETYYLLNKEDFEKMSIYGELKNIEDNVYIVNYNDAEVIYIKGINVNDSIKYKLSDIMTKEPTKKWILYNRIGE